MNPKQIKLVRAALLLAIALLAQQLRFILPLPRVIDTLVIGSLVNSSLALTACYTDLFFGALTTAALPLVAYLQGHLLVPVLIPVVFAGNFVFVLYCYFYWNRGTVIVAPILKTLMIYGGALTSLKILGFAPEKIDKIVLTLSWPQIVTGVLGILLARVITKRLESS